MAAKKKPKPKRDRKAEAAKKKAANGGVHPGGRPTDFKVEYCPQAYRLALLGAKDAEIAEFLGVCEKTLNSWKAEFPEFLQSMVSGKDQADAVIAESLFHRAKGYSHPEMHVAVHAGAVILTPLTKHYPPDTAAASLWLRNRQPARWRDKVESEVYGKNGGAIKTESTITLSPEEAYRKMLDG